MKLRTTCIAILCFLTAACVEQSVQATATDARTRSSVLASALRTNRILSEGLNCRVRSVRGELWLEHLVAGRATYSYRLGAGGSISALKLNTSNTLAASFKGEITDRVIQSVLFHTDLAMPKAITGKVWNNDYRFNINQSGNHYGNSKRTDGLAAIRRVSVEAGTCDVVVFVSARQQFNERLDPFFQGQRNFYLRYELRPEGELMIRKIEHWGERRIANGATGLGHSFWLDEWIPFNQQRGRFIAHSLYNDGSLGHYEHFRGTSDIPSASSTGYAVALSTYKRPTAAIGIVYGAKPALFNGGAHPAFTARLRVQAKGDVRLTDPQILYDGSLGPIAPGSLIVQAYALVPRLERTGVLNATLAAKLRALVDEIPAPHVLSPGVHLDQNVSNVAIELNQYPNLPISDFRQTHLLGDLAEVVDRLP